MTLILTIEIHVLQKRAYLTYSAIKVVYTAFTNSMNFDLSVFNDSLLSCSQVFTFFNSLLISVSLDFKGKSSILKYRVVSSAYIKKINLLVELTISLMHNLY